MSKNSNWELGDSRLDQDKVYQARKAADAEIELLNKEIKYNEEKKQAILDIYEKNFQMKEFLLKAEEKGLSTATQSILDFMANYNFLLEKSMHIKSLVNNQLVINTNKQYLELEQRINSDMMSFMSNEIPELMNNLDKIDKENPCYESLKEGVESLIRKTIDTQKTQLANLEKQQSDIFANNQEQLKKSLLSLDNTVKERLLPIYSELKEQKHLTKKLDSILSEKQKQLLLE
ncbi:MAG: hypothetical protein PHF36_06010 [Candidatus Cloacimonetes bacterium]|nr:hypothetical protein [Candidatus Cloacimonadota bacterium]MDD3502163.1 hypothetical protein [Candidatus Cloacimonadota bacterium]